MAEQMRHAENDQDVVPRSRCVRCGRPLVFTGGEWVDDFLGEDCTTGRSRRHHAPRPDAPDVNLDQPKTLGGWAGAV